MKKNIILLFLLLAFNNYQSQDLMEKQILNVASPEVATLMRYNDFSDIDYIGKTDISVPIYAIKFGKLNIPIGLSYNTKGNKVADIATSVGLGWNLNAGGNLTVKVNDQNDFTETYSYYTNSSFEPEQSLAWHRQSKGYLCTDWPGQLFYSNTTGQQLCINHRVWDNDDKFIDAAPDFYYLNAPGLNDKFYLSRISDTQFKANFFNITNAKLNNSLNLIIKPTCGGFESTYWGNQGKATVFYQPDKFEFIGENGYIYTFNDFEYSIIREYPEDMLSHYDLQVNNWYLTKIKDPVSGKDINFEYESFVNNYEHPALTKLSTVGFGNYNVAQNYALGSAQSIYEPSPLIYNRLTTSQLKPKRIKRIITQEENIDFNYAFDRLDYPGNGLSSIIIKNKNAITLKQAVFNYSYFDSDNCTSGNYECKRLKLDNITDSTLGTYNFYYDSNNFPSRSSSKVDFLGYYNNNSSNIIFSKDNYQPYNGNYYPSTKTYFYPDLPNDNLLPFQLINKAAYSTSEGVDRTPSIASRLGLLQRVIYPTGGSLELVYENDDFMYEGVKYILGSTRVGGMKLFDSQNSLTKEIKYKYINDNNTSSGQINFLTTPNNSVRTEISSGIGFNTGAVVGYSRIIEETTGKGYIEKKYSNFNDYPDKFMQSDYNFADQGTKNFLKFLKFPHSYVQSFDDRRGKLLSANYYKEGISTPITKKTYAYDYNVKDSIKVQKVFSSYDYTSSISGTYTASGYFLRYFNNLKSSSNEELFSGSKVKEDNFFNYDDTRLTYKKTVSGGDIIEEYYRNAKDKNIQKLIAANILDKSVEIERKKNGKVISKQEVKYETAANNLPTSELSYNLATGNLEQVISYDRYDNRANLLQYTTKNGIPVPVIWGYRQSQPIAKIEGADYSRVMQAFGLNGNDPNAYLNLDIVKKSDLHYDAVTEAELILKLKEFSMKTDLKDAHISTYTHLPLIGVKSMTSLSGNKESYQYDPANRLEKVVDNNNNIVKEYKYNYAPTVHYNSEKSPVFTRTTCGPGTLPEPTIYRVPVGKYSSTISQADADQKAQNDIIANGQAYANTNGVCKPYVCTVTPSYNVSIYYSAFQETSANHIKAIISLPVNDPNLNWSGGLFIGTLQDLCRPHSYKNISINGWSISIAPNGGVTLYSGGSSSGGVATLNFEYDK